MKKLAILALSFVWLGTCVSFAADSSYKQALSKTPAAELPAKAASIIKDAKARERNTVTLDVVKAAVELNPAAALAIVSAVARAVPESAATAAAVAASEQPKQAAAIARAAAAAAPTKAGKIVVAVCRASPNDYNNVAVAVAQAVPGSGKAILEAVAAALPDLKSDIERALAGYSGSPTTVSAALDAKGSSDSANPLRTPVTLPAPLARGPAIGPPFIPLSGTPTNVNPSSGGNVPPGGRDYAPP